MSNLPQNLQGQFPLTAPDIAVSFTGSIADADALMTETTSEIQNLQQALTCRLIETPGSNLDFGSPNNRGIGIMLYLSAPAERLVGLAQRIDAEFELDTRVVTSSTTLVQQAGGGYLISSVVQTVVGVFGLSWGWSQAGVAPLPPSTG